MAVHNLSFLSALEAAAGPTRRYAAAARRRRRRRLPACSPPHHAALSTMSDVSALGWQGKYKHDSPEVAKLRERLAAEAGIAGVEVVDPAEPGYAEKAARIFHRDGFVLVKDCLTPEKLERVRAAAAHTITEMVKHDPLRVGNRGSHRYCFSNSFNHFGHCAEWALLIDPPPVLAVLEAIYGSPNFRLQGVGGDFVLPGCTQYQGLHRDFGDFLHDPSGRLDFRDLPPSEIAVNYPMEVVEGSAVGHTPWNGVTRQIPGTQRSREAIPDLDSEPNWMKLSVTSPAPAGAAMIRDHRAWCATQARLPCLFAAQCPRAPPADRAALNAVCVCVW
jgi:hypothetical protein